MENGKSEVLGLSQRNVNIKFFTTTDTGPKHLEKYSIPVQFESLLWELISWCQIPVNNALEDAQLISSDIQEVV